MTVGLVFKDHDLIFEIIILLKHFLHLSLLFLNSFMKLLEVWYWRTIFKIFLKSFKLLHMIIFKSSKISQFFILYNNHISLFMNFLLHLLIEFFKSFNFINQLSFIFHKEVFWVLINSSFSQAFVFISCHS